MAGVKFTPDAARQIVETVRQSRGKGTTRLIGHGSRKISVRDGWVTFKNVGSQAIPPNGVIRVNSSTVAIPGDKHNAILSCQRPTTEFTRIYAVNSSLEVAAGQCGECRLPPFDNVEVLYDTTSGTPTLGDGWGPKPDSFKLFKNYPCTAIAVAVLSDLSGSETMLASWGPIVSGIGKANGTISNRASGAISIWQGTLGSESEISSMDPTAFNLGPDLASGDWVSYDHINGQLVCVKLCA